MKSTKEPKVKLTLTVKKSAIENAKKYAQLDGSSLSSIVEDYLVEYSKTSKAENQSDFKNSLAYQLMGCAKGGPLDNMTDDEIKDMRIKDRYGL
ncbi:DUF6364 family protein [Dyadobacter chenwenxiniae]|uniref:DUF6364 family protein n=1 Tax=Dyadobacter chenwenxiniae TaxID=2906456 RepID=A0A9X1PMX8_9BACT|nr:DUF6364 family protein [Dyadobacter chenwenxiniae]MCF0050900.1 DUF6364 family protein [Dyadobacter chenwenxiniae]MCF0062939.1 DUF6364 family protein [Dyadobacter chenwenxiniae]UON84887.1 DUF6364 family protein [Dyadobacter chenwenxiniae]